MKQIWPKEEDKNPLVFSDVKVGQFFVDTDGWLCGKEDHSCYVYLTDHIGKPMFSAHKVHNPSKWSIKEILPEITKLGIVELSDD